MKRSLDIRIDHEAQQIILSRKYMKLSSIFNSTEYHTLQRAKDENVGYAIVLRQIKKSTKESYTGLTYAYMEDYIKSHENSALRWAEYKEKRKVAQCHDSAYPRIKSWFLNAYPEVKKEGFSIPKNLVDSSDSSEMHFIKEAENGEENAA